MLHCHVLVSMVIKNRFIQPAIRFSPVKVGPECNMCNMQCVKCEGHRGFLRSDFCSDRPMSAALVHLTVVYDSFLVFFSRFKMSMKEKGHLPMVSYSLASRSALMPTGTGCLRERSDPPVEPSFPDVRQRLWPTVCCRFVTNAVGLFMRTENKSNCSRFGCFLCCPHSCQSRSQNAVDRCVWSRSRCASACRRRSTHRSRSKHNHDVSDSVSPKIQLDRNFWPWTKVPFS